MRHPFIFVLPQHSSRLFFLCGPPWPSFNGIFSTAATSEAFFPIPVLDQSRRSCCLPATLPVGWCQLFWLLRFFWRAASQDLSEPGPRRHRTAVSPQLRSSSRCELLMWEVGSDDGKMFVPTWALFSSCCDTELEKHPYFHFLTYFSCFYFTTFFSSSTTVIRPDIRACAIKPFCIFFLNLLKCTDIRPKVNGVCGDEFPPEGESVPG